jgi:hypothetical protein
LSCQSSSSFTTLFSFSLVINQIPYLDKRLGPVPYGSGSNQAVQNHHDCARLSSSSTAHMDPLLQVPGASRRLTAKLRKPGTTRNRYSKPPPTSHVLTMPCLAWLTVAV